MIVGIIVPILFVKCLVAIAVIRRLRKVPYKVLFESAARELVSLRAVAARQWKNDAGPDES